jgi:hypothetical protein
MSATTFSVDGNEYHITAPSMGVRYVCGIDSKEYEAVFLPYYYHRSEVIVCNNIRKVEGFVDAEPLPYLYIPGHTLIVVEDAYYIGTLSTTKGVLGIKVPVYQEAVSLPPVGCRACSYYTGEACLPCAVNPMQYPNWGECRDYEAI